MAFLWARRLNSPIKKWDRQRAGEQEGVVVWWLGCVHGDAQLSAGLAEVLLEISCSSGYELDLF